MRVVLFYSISRVRRLAELFGPAVFPPVNQRFSRRGSKRYSIGWLILIFLKSECLGFNRKFISLVLSTLGTASATDIPRRTQSSPIRMVSNVGGSAFQCGGRFLSGKYSVSLSLHSSRKERYRSVGEIGIV